MSKNQAASLLVGCAKLGKPPSPDILVAFWQVVERDGANSANFVANAAWALAVLQARLHGWHRTVGGHSLASWYFTVNLQPHK